MIQDTEGRKARVWSSITTARNYRKQETNQGALKESAAKERERGDGLANTEVK